MWRIIQSIQNQVYPNWELLIVDDGSTDNTKQVVAEFQNDERIHYFYKKHENGSIARNYGLQRVKGDIITYVDSDDAVYDNYLLVALEHFSKHSKKIFATCNYNRRRELYDKEFKLLDFTDVSSSQKQEVTLQDFYHWNVKTCGTGIFHRRSVIDKGLVWDKNFRMLDDLDFILQMGKMFPSGYFHIPYALFEYLQKYGGDGICSTTSYLEQARAFEKIFKKHKNDPLMSGQQWYPEKVMKYKKMQTEYKAGRVPSPNYKYFPKYSEE